MASCDFFSQTATDSAAFVFGESSQLWPPVRAKNLQTAFEKLRAQAHPIDLKPKIPMSYHVQLPRLPQASEKPQRAVDVNQPGTPETPPLCDGKHAKEDRIVAWTQLNCGHLLCRPCVDELGQESSRFNCPACKTPISQLKFTKLGHRATSSSNLEAFYDVQGPDVQDVQKVSDDKRHGHQSLSPCSPRSRRPPPLTVLPDAPPAYSYPVHPLGCARPLNAEYQSVPMPLQHLMYQPTLFPGPPSHPVLLQTPSPIHELHHVAQSPLPERMPEEGFLPVIELLGLPLGVRHKHIALYLCPGSLPDPYNHPLSIHLAIDAKTGFFTGRAFVQCVDRSKAEENLRFMNTAALGSDTRVKWSDHGSLVKAMFPDTWALLSKTSYNVRSAPREFQYALKQIREPRGEFASSPEVAYFVFGSLIALVPRVWLERKVSALLSFKKLCMVALKDAMSLALALPGCRWILDMLAHTTLLTPFFFVAEKSEINSKFLPHDASNAILQPFDIEVPRPAPFISTPSMTMPSSPTTLDEIASQPLPGSPVPWRPALKPLSVNTNRRSNRSKKKRMPKNATYFAAIIYPSSETTEDVRQLPAGKQADLVPHQDFCIMMQGQVEPERPIASREGSPAGKNARSQRYASKMSTLLDMARLLSAHEDESSAHDIQEVDS